MRTESFDYPLPDSAIARHPTEARDGARLLVLDDEGVTHRRIAEWAELVPAGALVVLNDTRVVRARLFGRKRGTGGKVELLFLQRQSAPKGVERWRALGKASKSLRVGSVVETEALAVEVVDRDEEGTLTVDVRGEHSVEAAFELEGHVPLPPYLNRADEPADAERYQTVYARRAGSVAAPTAGLHLTEALLARLEERGVGVGRLLLHVGVGTFRPVVTEDLDAHRMHAEWVEIDDELVRQVEAARSRGGQVVAVGTTVVRALESAADPRRPGLVLPHRGETRLLIQPGYPFQVVDALLTNFHMPKSTLLALVAAFAGRERVLQAYSEALAEGYRFLSYGDAMWLPERRA